MVEVNSVELLVNGWEVKRDNGKRNCGVDELMILFNWWWLLLLNLLFSLPRLEDESDSPCQCWGWWLFVVTDLIKKCQAPPCLVLAPPAMPSFDPLPPTPPDQPPTAANCRCCCHRHRRRRRLHCTPPPQPLQRRQCCGCHVIFEIN